eukprot:CAMPEP_0206221166 /NCGR_PEP_ID=MMETSP0047_2-20121206/5264_1 /ASSEMBLY_ACC=CAM_ASM_000192 /TAXON_ID=195065 /ORGANISM="Chroomonas mesostigmatica_cf, Strain CCMP1168" /LENGTH=69 /DNA_ID=CAMNT_0053643871 /DNA_START=16 /DNA_END=225 /DNA_ORIENTATION=+
MGAAKKKTGSGPTDQEKKATAAALQAASPKCTVCLAVFAVTSKPSALIAHQVAKHDKKTPQECFPGVAF